MDLVCQSCLSPVINHRQKVGRRMVRRVNLIGEKSETVHYTLGKVIKIASLERTSITQHLWSSYPLTMLGKQFYYFLQI